MMIAVIARNVFRDVAISWIRLPRRALLCSALLAMTMPLHAAKTMFSSAHSVDEVQKRLAALPADGALRKKAILYSDLGTLLYRQGQMVQASEAFETALTYRTTQDLRRHISLFMGKAYESSGRRDKAISAYQEALRTDPGNWRRHRDLAGLYEEVRLYRKARDFYASARELAPREPSLHFVSGRILRKMGLYKEAEPYFSKADVLGHDDNAIHRELSFVKEGRGDAVNALVEWRKGAGTSEAPEDIARLIYLAVLIDDQGGAKADLKRLKGAGAAPETLQLYENLIELGPAAPEIQALVGQFLADRHIPVRTGKP